MLTVRTAGDRHAGHLYPLVELREERQQLISDVAGNLPSGDIEDILPGHHASVFTTEVRDIGKVSDSADCSPQYGT